MGNTTDIFGKSCIWYTACLLYTSDAADEEDSVDLGVQVVGGCCGTTPAHIGSLVELSTELKPAERPSRSKNQNDDVRPNFDYEPAAASIYGVTPYHQDNSLLIIGERLNASGSRKVRELLAEEDLSLIHI